MGIEEVIFGLPEELRVTISEDETFFSYYHYIVADPKPTSIGATMISLGIEIGGSYRVIDNNALIRLGQSIQPVFLEAAKNAVIHGPGKGVFIGLFVGNKGAVYGFRDFGEYFKDQEVKHKWENRIPVLSSVTDERGKRLSNGICGGSGHGDDMIYSESDLIHVDNNLGILYCFQKKERLFELAMIKREDLLHI